MTDARADGARMAVDIPTPMTTCSDSPSFAAHSGAERTCGRIAAVRPDADAADGQQDGPSPAKNSSGVDSPTLRPTSSSTSDIGPGDAKPRDRKSSIARRPVSTAGIQSHNSTAHASRRRLSEPRSRCRTFDQKHSDE